MISSHQRRPCQLLSLSSDDKVISPTMAASIQDNSETFCVPCRWLSKKCGQARIYKKHEGKSICVCAAGNIVGDCSTSTYTIIFRLIFLFYFILVCDNDFFGRGCEKYSRMRKYIIQVSSLFNLSLSSSTAISADPRVHNVDVNQAFITVPGYKEEINYSTHNYVIEYKVTDFVLHLCRNLRIDVQQERSSELWIQLGKSYPVGKEVSLEMVGLRANTTYDVRSVITSEHNETKKSYATFTTKCLSSHSTTVFVNCTILRFVGLNASLFAIQSSNTSATISLLEPVKR
jgi:hypothetical protein